MKSQFQPAISQNFSVRYQIILVAVQTFLYDQKQCFYNIFPTYYGNVRNNYEASQKFIMVLRLQLTTLLSEIGLNIQEAHAFSTLDGYSLDVFVVDGWAGQVVFFSIEN
jgi:hypothetical protein